jgi:hypothetical protein
MVARIRDKRETLDVPFIPDRTLSRALPDGFTIPDESNVDRVRLLRRTDRGLPCGHFSAADR